MLNYIESLKGLKTVAQEPNLRCIGLNVLDCDLCGFIQSSWIPSIDLPRQGNELLLSVLSQLICVMIEVYQ